MWLLEQKIKEDYTRSYLQSLFQTIFPINLMANSNTKIVEIELGKTINNTSTLEVFLENQLIKC